MCDACVCNSNPLFIMVYHEPYRTPSAKVQHQGRQLFAKTAWPRMTAEVRINVSTWELTQLLKLYHKATHLPAVSSRPTSSLACHVNSPVPPVFHSHSPGHRQVGKYCHYNNNNQKTGNNRPADRSSAAARLQQEPQPLTLPTSRTSPTSATTAFLAAPP